MQLVCAQPIQPCHLSCWLKWADVLPPVCKHKSNTILYACLACCWAICPKLWSIAHKIPCNSTANRTAAVAVQQPAWVLQAIEAAGDSRLGVAVNALWENLMVCDSSDGAASDPEEYSQCGTEWAAYWVQLTNAVERGEALPDLPACGPGLVPDTFYRLAAVVLKQEVHVIRPQQAEPCLMVYPPLEGKATSHSARKPDSVLCTANITSDIDW